MLDHHAYIFPDSMKHVFIGFVHSTFRRVLCVRPQDFTWMCRTRDCHPLSLPDRVKHVLVGFELDSLVTGGFVEHDSRRLTQKEGPSLEEDGCKVGAA